MLGRTPARKRGSAWRFKKALPFNSRLGESRQIWGARSGHPWDGGGEGIGCFLGPYPGPPSPGASQSGSPPRLHRHSAFRQRRHVRPVRPFKTVPCSHD